MAIGNGTACRETESLVSDCIAAGMKVQYTIVSEQGASIYSCSSLASQEFPDLDTNLISAVSIGRRLQDPLSELVKVEPQHLGVGMYQHDLPQARLSTALEQVVEECVSFVGVDINSCSEHLLRRVAGLNKGRAKAIVEFREKQGEFVTRSQLRKVKGVGEKVFLQCAGFLRVTPRTDGAGDYNPLDRTQIHPESYSAAEKVVSINKLNLGNLGKTHFCQKIKTFAEGADLTSLSRHRLSSQTSLEPRPRDTRKKKKKNLLCPAYEDSTDEIKGVQVEKTGGVKSSNTKLGTFTSARSRNKKGKYQS